MTYNNENIFAKIINGEADCVKILENDYILSFMDVMPQTPGHTLVIPNMVQKIFLAYHRNILYT